MPFVTIRLAGRAIDQSEGRALHAEFTRLMASVLGKRADLTAVTIKIANLDHWSIGAAPVPVAAHVEALITQGTNSAEEKACFVEEAYGVLEAFLGDDLSPATYVVLHEIPADAWGYGGMTQAARRRP